MELPWENNAVGESCVPAGIYICRFTFSPRFRKRMYELSGVRGRSAIRIHSGNFAGDTDRGLRSHVEGCILLGKGYGEDSGQDMILQSRQAVQEFETLLTGRKFQLEVRDPFELTG